MSLDDFRQYLIDRKKPEEQIAAGVAVAVKFEGFLAASGSHPPTAGDVEAFSTLLIREGLNTPDNFIGLIRYGDFLRNHEVIRAGLELFDGSEVIDNLFKKLGALVGETQRDEIFSGIGLPPLGTLSSEKPRFTQALMARMEARLDPEVCQQILSGSLRDLDDGDFLEGHQKFLASQNFDDYLAQSGKDFIAQLEQIKAEGRLFFTQEVNDDVIQFVRDTPLIRQGVREGNILYWVKIPYMTIPYLAETDPQMKRYYYCHCPWVRESIRRGDVSVSPRFCQCSAGFMKKPWEVIFGQPLEAEMVETVLTGAMWCKAAIHLPPQ